MEYCGLNAIHGPLVVLHGTENIAAGERVALVHNGETKTGQVLRLTGDAAVVQVFEGTHGMPLESTRLRFLGQPFCLPLSENILGRVLDGLGRPVDDLGPLCGALHNINGRVANPVCRRYPRAFIQTGFSSIDGLVTLVRGQKLPVFSANGLPHDQLAMDIASRATCTDGAPFAVVFAAMGASSHTAMFYRQALEESGALAHSVMLLNHAYDPVMERLVTPKAALTIAEFLAYHMGLHVLVILTDMTAYGEALREVSAARGEIPGRKGFPGYLYSALSALYERAGILQPRYGTGSVTQLPILTMPGDDITHPIPDLTGFITEGQVVLSRALHRQGIYPPVDVLPSLSRLMKDGIGKGFTQEDHPQVAAQMYAAYAQAGEARALAAIIGEAELSPADRAYIQFGDAFEKVFLCQTAPRNIEETLQQMRTLLQPLSL